jgi:hypothetical protein
MWTCKCKAPTWTANTSRNWPRGFPLPQNIQRSFAGNILPIQRVTWFVREEEVKRFASDVDHILLSSADVNEWIYTSTPPICFHGEDGETFLSLVMKHLFYLRLKSCKNIIVSIPLINILKPFFKWSCINIC